MWRRKHVICKYADTMDVVRVVQDMNVLNVALGIHSACLPSDQDAGYLFSVVYHRMFTELHIEAHIVFESTFIVSRRRAVQRMRCCVTDSSRERLSALFSQ